MSSTRGVTPSLVDLLTVLLRDGTIPDGIDASIDVADVLDVARDHGVLSLVADRLSKRDDAPDQLHDVFRLEATRRAALEIVREAELRRVLAALAAASINPILMKGAHLAYGAYERPDMRPRLDTDLMIAETDRNRCREVLAGLGYEEAGQVDGESVMSQTCYIKPREGASLHAIDIHWRPANPVVFADLLTYGEMARAAVALPRLSPVARGLCDVHALLVACVHRVAHHFDAPHLIWLYDIHLLASRLTEPEWREFAALTKERQVASITMQSLTRTRDAFGTRLPADVLSQFETAAQAGELSATYVSLTPRSRREMQVFLSDFQAIESWPGRWRLVREHVFPPVRYMRDVYAPSSRVPLYVLYAWRALRGARKWLVRT